MTLRIPSYLALVRHSEDPRGRRPSEEAYAARLAAHREAIERYARFWARGDEDLEEDLRQEGMIGLWELDLRRAADEGAYVRRMLRYRMSSCRRAMERGVMGEGVRVEVPLLVA
jgi:DNA-directed RNA polymerase specialized sigma24 family protein